VRATGVLFKDMAEISYFCMGENERKARKNKSEKYPLLPAYPVVGDNTNNGETPIFTHVAPGAAHVR
jgi:hypothetical protein